MLYTYYFQVLPNYRDFLSKVTEYLHIFHLLNILSPPIYTLFFSALKLTWGLCYLKKQEDTRKKNQMLWSNNPLKAQPAFFLTFCSLLHPCSLAAVSPSAETSPSPSETKRPPHTHSLLQLSAPSEIHSINTDQASTRSLMKSWLRPLTFPVKDNQFAMGQNRADQ